MRKAHGVSYDQLDRNQHEVLDRLAIRFENALKAGQGPRIEDALIAEPYDSAMRGIVFQELLALELEYKARRGEIPPMEDYQRRFPQETDDISSVFVSLTEDLVDDAEPVSTSRASMSALTKESGTDVKSADSGPNRSVAEEPPLPQKLGRYEILKLIARGGFGRVLLAKDLELDRLVAVKVAHRALFLSKEDVDRYLKEARIAARLSHPNIVAIHDVGSTEELGCYIVMDYIDGGALDVEAAVDRLDMIEAVSLVAQIADAVHHAHTKGLVHRDLKPGNLLLDRRGVPYVVDFGLAVHESEQYDHEGEVSGTPPYMSPEQVRGLSHQLDGRTDIWSLGVLLYELLTGRKPFQGATQQRVFDEILHRDPKPLRQIDDRIPAELERICLRALAEKPAERYGTALDLAEELRAAMPAMSETSFPVPPVPPPVVRTAGAAKQPWPWKWTAVAVGSALALWVLFSVVNGLWPDSVANSVHGLAEGSTTTKVTPEIHKRKSNEPATNSKQRVSTPTPLQWAELPFRCSLTARCTHLAVSGEGGLVIVSSIDGNIDLYRLEGQDELLGNLQHVSPIREVCLSADNSLLGALCEGEPVVYLYSTEKLEPITTTASPIDPIRLLPSPGSDGLRFIDRAGTALLVRDAQTGAPEQRLNNASWQGLQVTETGDGLVLAGYDLAAGAWKILVGGTDPRSVDTQPFHSIDVTRVGGQFVLGGYGPAVGVQLRDGPAITQLTSPDSHSLSYHRVAFFDDDALVVDVSQRRTADGDGATTVVRAWQSTGSRSPVLEKSLDGAVQQVAFDAAGNLICLAFDTYVRVYELTSPW